MKKYSTKRSLVASILILCLCFTSFVGTTFAWFTDSVTSSNNIIKSGNLDIALEKWNGTAWEDASTGPIFSYDKWEPGYTQVVNLRVRNLGTLALKWQAVITTEKNLSILADVINVYVRSGKTEADVKVSTDVRIEDYAAGNFTKYTLREFINSVGSINKGSLKANEDDYLGMILAMDTAAGNEYMNLDLGGNFNLTILATQETYEGDSFDNLYDEFAGLPWDGVSKSEPKADANGVIHVTNAAELVAMMDTTGNSIYSGKTIVLDADINLAGKTVKGIGSDTTNFAGIFDGQGHTISNFTIDASNRSYYAGLFNQVSHGGAVKNLTVKGATVIGKSMVGAVASSVDSNATVDNCKAIDCTLIGVKKVGSVIGYSLGSAVTNNYAENCSVYYSEKEGSEVLGFENTGSTVSGNIFTNVTLVNSYAIANAAQLKAFADDVNSGNNYQGKTIVLSGDINLGGMAWTPIGNGTNGFSGTFDGCGYTISNYSVNVETGAGLFGYALNGGNIKNLKVKDAVISANDYAGAILGRGYTDVVNCHAENVKVTVTPYYVSAKGVYDGGAKAGAIVGQLLEGSGNTVVDCSAKNVEIVGYRDLGGVLGMAHNNNSVSGCTASDVTIEYLSVDGVYDDGATPNQNAGAIVGRINSSATVSFVNAGDNEKFTLIVPVSSVQGIKDILAGDAAEKVEITLDSDLTVSETITVPAAKNVTLDLNGKNLSYAVSNSGASAIIANKGNLEIVGNGTISFVAENPDLGAIPAYATNTITNTGSLIIGEGVTVTNGSEGGASYAVDNHGTFVLDGGTLIGNRCALRVAKYNQDNVSFVMNSGLIKAMTPFWIQLPGSDANTAPKISVEIKGGTVQSTKPSSADNDAFYSYSYGNSHANTSITINGGEFLGGTVSIGSGYKGDAPKFTITGGVFEYDVLQWLAGDTSKVLYAANK